MQAAMMIANPCRPWVWSIGCGAESTYESKIQQSTQIRMAALAAEEPESVDAADEESDDGRDEEPSSAMPTVAQRASMKAYCDSANSRIHTLKLQFRDVFARSDFDAVKFGRADAKRRSLLSRAMENPKLLVLAK